MIKRILLIIGIILLALIVMTIVYGGKRYRRRISADTLEKRRRLAFGAVLCGRNNMSYTDLYDASNIDRRSALNALDEHWGVTDHHSAIRILDWLKCGGHHDHSYDSIYRQLIGQNGDIEVSQTAANSFRNACEVLIKDFGYTQKELTELGTVSAWDYDRLVWLARICQGVGFISAEQAWAYIADAADAGSEDYNDWRSYFAGVLLGRAIWSDDEQFPQDDRDIAKSLIMDKNSIYYQVPFK